MRDAKNRLLAACDPHADAAALAIHGEPGSGKRFFARLAHHQWSRRPADRIVELDLPDDWADARRMWSAAAARAVGGMLIVCGLDGRADLALAQLASDPALILISRDRLDLDGGIIPITQCRVPALRERGADFAELVSIAARAAARTMRGQPPAPPRVTAQAMDRLSAYAWPDNVRELQDVMHRAILAAGRGEPIDQQHLPYRIRRIAPSDPGLRLDAVVRAHVLHVFQAHSQNRRSTAAALAISRSTLHRHLARAGVEPGPDFARSRR